MIKDFFSNFEMNIVAYAGAEILSITLSFYLFIKKAVTELP